MTHGTGNTDDNPPVTSYGFDPSASRDVGIAFYKECSKALTNGTCPEWHNGVVQAVESYGMVSKGNGDCFLMKERHTSLACGGGQAGQGYPCVVERSGKGECECQKEVYPQTAGTLCAGVYKMVGTTQDRATVVIKQDSPAK